MFAKIILCATKDGLTAGIWRLGRLLSHQVFLNDTGGQQEFSSFLQQHPNKSIYLIVDALEEDYRLESLPHATGNARKELLDRKLGQIYRGVAFRTAHFIQREKERRKDDRYLFAALNNADFLQKWLNVIEARQAPLVGVYLLSMISQTLVRRSKLMDPHILLSEQLVSGLRQTYLHNGRLRMSRHAPIESLEPGKFGYFYLVETEKTRLYLQSQRFIASDAVLTMVIPTLDEKSFQQLARDIEQDQELKCLWLDLGAFAKRLNLRPELLRSAPELLHMHLLANGHVPDNLAPQTRTRYHQINFIRRSINVASIVVLLGGLAAAGFYFKQSVDQTRSLEQAASDTAMQERFYNEVAKDFPETPIASTDLQILGELEQAIKSNIKSPQRVMQILSRAIEASPEIKVNRLRWLLSKGNRIQDEDRPLGTQTNPGASGAEPPSALLDSTGLYEVGILTGEITGFRGDYRAALESVNKLAEKLRADNSVEQVTILQAPVNVSSFTDLQGSTSDERIAQLPAVLFKLMVILKREVPQA